MKLRRVNYNVGPDRHVQTGPHEFRRMSRWFNRGRCLHCHAHENFHPTRGWLPARAWRDKTVPFKDHWRRTSLI